MIYGPNTEAVQSIIDRIPTLTEDECKQLTAAYGAAMDAAGYASWGAAYGATWNAARVAAWYAAWDEARDAALNASYYASYYAAYGAAMDAVLATVTYDLATIDGPYTIAQRDLLLAPWIEVCGMPDGLIARAALAGEE